jgi:hypothetical protein
MHSVKLSVTVTVTFLACSQCKEAELLIFILSACLSQVGTREITQNIIRI